ncbi:hypothetical protein DY000_02004035 [Brassica cretica]|uniref:Uncharacterized protein n=1 Tax=Brassica cretica TaxID=69181 RepID=A0ABQ7C705_BRACR|nr:hypothetical protein DY000_02004035 [Brassica cretica]
MSTENLDRGTGPLRLEAGRVWTEDLVSRKTGGLAGWCCAVNKEEAGDDRERRYEEIDGDGEEDKVPSFESIVNGEDEDEEA